MNEREQAQANVKWYAEVFTMCLLEGRRVIVDARPKPGYLVGHPPDPDPSPDEWLQIHDVAEIIFKQFFEDQGRVTTARASGQAIQDGMRAAMNFGRQVV